MNPTNTKPFTFYFKKESVVMHHNKQYIAFHSYTLKNKKSLRSFADNLIHTPGVDINTVFAIARKHQVPSMGTSAGACRAVQERSEARKDTNRIVW